MKIGLIDVDVHNFPNLALMKISAYHKSKGDEVEWFFGFNEYDKVYMSKVFTFTEDFNQVINAKEIIKTNANNCLPLILIPPLKHIIFRLLNIINQLYQFFM